MLQQLATLCEEIHMPEQATRVVLQITPGLDLCTLRPMLEGLFHETQWEESLAGLRTVLGDDPHGFKILTCELLCALKTREIFRERGISEEIFVETMKCFTRFVCEHHESYGRYGFDRAFWTPRQISVKLLRIEQLEYELAVKDGEPVISLHIPADGRLNAESVDETLAETKEFLKTYFPDYPYKAIFCSSWILTVFTSPRISSMADLALMLTPGSLLPLLT